MRKIRDFTSFETVDLFSQCFLCHCKIPVLKIYLGRKAVLALCALCAGELFSKGYLQWGFNPSKRDPYESYIEIKDWEKFLDVTGNPL